MAGISWIKLETTFPRKPVVLIVASTLGIDTNTVIGALVSLLCWADGVVEDGRFGFDDTTIIDHITNCSGLGNALVKAGWIINDDEGHLCLNHWDVHNGECAKRRAMVARSVAKHKANKAVNKNDYQSKQNCLPNEVNKSDYLDKIRIDNIDNTSVLSLENTPHTPLRHNEFAYQDATVIIPEQGKNIEFLNAYGKRPKSISAFMRNWSVAVAEVKDDTLLVQAAKIAIQSMIDKEGDTTYLPTPENWLGDRKYRDYLSRARTSAHALPTNKFTINYDEDE